jgi:hypothetical protein
MMSKIMNKSFMSATAGSFGILLLASLAIGSSSARASGATPLTLINGWKPHPCGTICPANPAAVRTFNGIVHLKGGIYHPAQSTVPEPFVLPAAFRPATAVYVPVVLSQTARGRLYIQPNGIVTIESEGDFKDARSFTSLDGATFALNGGGFTALTLINGWTNAPFGTSNAAVKKINGVVHFKGAIATAGSSDEPFLLPVGFRPATVVFVAVDLCNSANGRLIISPSGSVQVQAEIAFSSAQCFTSLDGVLFVATSTGYTNLTLQNGWHDTIYGTASPAANTAKHGFPVYLKGAISKDHGTEEVPFILPVADRPQYLIAMPIDLCDATKGDLEITFDGVVSVGYHDTVSDEHCFTSLDGVSFIQ